MGSVASTNSGLTDLLQTLTQNTSPEMSSVLSMPSVQSALENASPADIVQISTQALELQGIGELFGDSTASTTPTASDPLLAAVESQLAQSGSTAAAASTAAPSATTATSAADSSSSQDQASSAAGSATSAQTSSAVTSAQSLQAAELEALFGDGSTSSSTDSLLNMLG
jgi:hypothetical protein